MPRAKSSVASRARRKKVLKRAKGYFGSKRVLFRTANEQVMRSLRYSYIGRKQRKREFRKLWIQRINAACKANDFKYSRFIYGLSLANITINRKMLADIAAFDAPLFTELVEVAKNAIDANSNGQVVEKVEVKAVKKVEKPVVKEEKPVEKVEVKETQKVEKPVVKEEKVEAIEEAVDLNAMTVAELKELAKSRSLTGYSALKKAELIELLK